MPTGEYPEKWRSARARQKEELKERLKWSKAKLRSIVEKEETERASNQSCTMNESDVYIVRLSKVKRNGILRWSTKAPEEIRGTANFDEFNAGRNDSQEFV
ncbi:hypothetical protein KM043_005651 [Ampulex compressa]|nr:hypothetical protein KM043_005651 [Ampulex compressa]